MIVLARATGPIALGAEPVAVSLEAVPGTPARTPLPADGLHLVLRDLHTDAPPGVLYQVHLGPPPDTAPEAEGRQPLGTFHFFGTLPAPTSPSSGDGAPSRFYSYDLPGDVPLRLPLTVTLVPRGTPDPAASPTVGTVELAREGPEGR